MRCDYCGAENSSGGSRCIKCQRRLELDRNGWDNSAYPVVATAAAPDFSEQPEPFEQPSRGRFETVAANPAVTRRLPPRQRSLFQDGRKVVELDTQLDADHGARQAKDPLAPASKRTTRRGHVNANQEAFDFYGSAPARPAQPFTREMNRGSLRGEVAPVAVRAMAALFDAGVALALSVLFLIVVRLWLGFLPLAGVWMYFAPVPVLIGIAYKLAFALNGDATIGVQAMRLRVVSFDGERPTVMQRIVRVFMGMLSFVAAGLGVLWAITDEEHLTWHDMVTQTYVTSDMDVWQGGRA